MKKILLLTSLLAMSTTAQARTLTIGIDLSGSNPLLMHENFAHEAAKHVSSRILTLQEGDTVNVRSFGARDDASNLLNHSFEIGRRMRPKKLAKIISHYIGSIPQQDNISQLSTNLIAWLEFTSGFECGDQGEIIVITDGIESSTLIDGDRLVAGRAHLPAPEGDLKGCTVSYFGLGAGLQPQAIRILRKEWQGWFEKSEADFTAIIP